MKKLENGNYELTKEELLDLMISRDFLELMYCNGLDNWSGYYPVKQEFDDIIIQDTYNEIDNIE